MAWGPDYIEVGDFDGYVVAPWDAPVDQWLKEGFERWDPFASMWSIHDVLKHCTPEQVEFLWRAAFYSPLPENAFLWAIGCRLDEVIGRRSAPLMMLGRRVKRGTLQRHALPKPPEPGPPVLDTEHYVVVQTVDEKGGPVRGIRLELVVAGGEFRSAVTDQDGFARVERIRAGRVVIRVLGIDGGMWRPLDGEASQPSSQDSGIRWHEVKQGDCLSKIAHRYGLKSWKVLWEHPKNEPLRKKRESPHVLLPGDMVAVPGVRIYEIARATDGTYRIEVKEGPQRRGNRPTSPTCSAAPWDDPAPA
jgi:hypothetical protein